MRRDWETHSKRYHHLIRAGIVAEILALRMKKHQLMGLSDHHLLPQRYIGRLRVSTAKRIVH